MDANSLAKFLERPITTAHGDRIIRLVPERMERQGCGISLACLRSSQDFGFVDSQ